jgi:hypothetical protein
MEVFQVRDQLIQDYREFTGSFVEILDARIGQHVDERMARGYQWPDPWLSLNPSFASGGTVSELFAAGLLQPECERIFRLKEGSADGPVLRLHRHQREAVEAARTGSSYVLTTGTGSGKSLAYIIPIVDRVLAAKASGTYLPGIKAVIVYPMNALANSQRRELEKFLTVGYPAGPPVTFERYTGQESAEDRARIIAKPPDILLTNYVMLELILTRPRDRALVDAANGLSFLVLDELHTYRGRQGADVALLVRRLRDLCTAPGVQCIGTSATMTTEGDDETQRAAVAGVATTLFGVKVAPEMVIGETVERTTFPAGSTPDDLRLRIAALSPPATYQEFAADPLAAWIEDTLGFEPDRPADQPQRRRRPLTLPKAAAQLAEETGTTPGQCAAAIKATLHAGASITNPGTGRPMFAFRLHQFLSKGDNVYVTLESPGIRHVTSTYQVMAPADGSGAERILVPTAFCRECGQDYLVVTRTDKDGSRRYQQRRDNDASGGDAAGGYLFISDDLPWPSSREQVLTDNRLPYSWLALDQDGGQMIDPARAPYLPKPIRVDVTGREADPGTGQGTPAAYVPSPFRFCLRCRTSYEQARGNDFAKLAKLSAEGRSSAMSLITASIVRTLRQQDTDLDSKARKLLAFVDNRQDASLQAGHFNDFVQVTLLRGALHRALVKSADGLTDEIVAQRVSDELNLAMADFAQQPTAKYGQKDEAYRALREVTGYRLYLDLERGWRVTMPNLEQTGLLKIEYRDLAEVSADAQAWDGCHVALRGDDPKHREEIARALLDELRRNLAIDVEYLNSDGFEQVRRLSAQHLREPWSLPERERPPLAGVAFPGPGKRGEQRTNVYLSGRGQFGRFIRREYEARHLSLSTSDAQEIITDLFKVLNEAGLLTVAVPAEGDDVPGYRLRAAVIRWLAGNGLSGAEDRVRRTLEHAEGPRVNPFFRDLYQNIADTLAGLRAKEHTAQVPPADRQEREREFSDAELPVLFCSPTMELGVDINALSAVGLRNVPPTPANYAQRAGRAGRSGQPALVVTYCATGNAHDQYYFRRPQDMVGGSVAPPRLDLANEDLVRSHIHAIWLAETGADLHSSLTSILDTAGDAPTLAVQPEIWRDLAAPAAARRAADRARGAFAGLGGALSQTPWWRDGWIDDAVGQAPERFNQACQRWRELYQLAMREFKVQSARSVDPSLPAKQKERAASRARDARIQLGLLSNEDSDDFQTDFYSYRYFASEGFLPGYSFPRLPLAAYIPGVAGRREGDYIQRPRFIGIAEFGPGAVIYHEGARYQVYSVALPPAEQNQDGLVTRSARRCRDCGYLHEEAVGIDVCENCAEPLKDTTHALLRLTSVRTVRRDRISSDEEERRRAGFELQTAYRFAQHGARPGWIDATASGADGPLLDVRYGDSATVRVTNIGRTRRQKPDVHGYMIDVTTGRWLKESEPEDRAVPEESGLEDAGLVKRKQRVIPYVEDRRNIATVRLAEPVSTEFAITAVVALERGIEAAFQLEDSELSSERLPDSQGRGRALLVESAEGGAGVLRRLVDDADGLSRAARTALRIMHFDPDTGADRAGEYAAEGEEPCIKACYDCLLSFGNQSVHSLIDRHLIKDLMRKLSTCTVTKAGDQQDRRPGESVPVSANPRATEFIAWLASEELRLPDEIDTPAEGTEPDLIYHLADSSAAVFVLSGEGQFGKTARRDERAQDDLRDLGWGVVTIRPDADWQQVARRYPSVFGSRH